MQRIVTIFLGLGVAAVIGLAAATGSGADAPEVGGALPLAPTGIAAPNLSDSVLFIEGEPVTGFDGDTVWVSNDADAGEHEVSEGLPLAPTGMPEPDNSASVLFIEGEPVRPFNGDNIFDLPVVDNDN